MNLGEQVLAACDLPLESIDLPLWGPTGTFFVRRFSLADREQWELECYERSQKTQGPASALGIKAFIVTLGLVDKDGNRIFTTEQADAVAQKSAEMVSTASAAISKHNGLTKDDIEDLAKN